MAAGVSVDADEIRKETADSAPELAEHDRISELERQLEEANSKALYAAAEAQNTRRRLEAEAQQASSYAAAQFARDMLAIKDHVERALAAVTDELRADKTASQFSLALKRPLASLRRFSPATASVARRHNLELPPAIQHRCTCNTGMASGFSAV